MQAIQHMVKQHSPSREVPSARAASSAQGSQQWSIRQKPRNRTDATAWPHGVRLVLKTRICQLHLGSGSQKGADIQVILAGPQAHRPTGPQVLDVDQVRSVLACTLSRYRRSLSIANRLLTIRHTTRAPGEVLRGCRPVCGPTGREPGVGLTLFRLKMPRHQEKPAKGHSPFHGALARAH